MKIWTEHQGQILKKKPVMLQGINVEPDEFDDYITYQENNENYVEIYRTRTL